MKRLILITLAVLISVPAFADNYRPNGMTDSCFATYRERDKVKWRQSFNHMWDGANGETCRLVDPCKDDKACERKRGIEDRQAPILKSRPCRLKEPCPPDGWIRYYE